MKKIVLLALPLLALASCTGNEFDESSATQPQTTGESVISSQASITSNVTSASNPSSSAGVSSNSLTSNTSYEVPAGLTSISLSGGSRLDVNESADGMSLSIDADSGAVTLHFEDNSSALVRLNDDGTSTGYVSIEQEYVTSYSNGNYILSENKLSIEERDDFYFVTYKVKGISGSDMNRYYAFPKEGGTPFVSSFRYYAPMDMHYGSQYIIRYDGYGWAYIHNQYQYFGMSLYRENRTANKMIEDGIYELRKDGMDSIFVYHVEGVFTRASVERGTYTCSGKQDLVLDGFGTYTLGENSGHYTYQNDGKTIYVFQGEELVNPDTYELDMEHHTYTKVEVTPTGDPSPIAKGSYYEGMQTFVSNATAMVLEIHLSFAYLADNKVSEMIYSCRLPSQTYAQTKINLGDSIYTYTESDRMIHFDSSKMSTWSFEVSSDVKTLYLRDNPLGIDNSDNSHKITLQVDMEDEW